MLPSGSRHCGHFLGSVLPPPNRSSNSAWIPRAAGSSRVFNRLETTTFAYRLLLRLRVF
jgi:hypothetical protein